MARTFVAQASRSTTALAAGVGVLLLVYTGVRAWRLSFTHDESLTYTRLVGRSIGSLVRYEDASANHHLLNTLTMKAAAALAGPSELSLRAASVAACAIYVADVLLWARELREPFFGLAAFAVACLNPFVLDFFSLARGYAAGLAGVAVAALFVLRFASRPTTGRARTSGC